MSINSHIDAHCKSAARFKSIRGFFSSFSDFPSRKTSGNLAGRFSVLLFCSLVAPCLVESSGRLTFCPSSLKEDFVTHCLAESSGILPFCPSLEEDCSVLELTLSVIQHHYKYKD